MLTGIGAWLRKQREARGWARREMARRLIQAAMAVEDTTVPGIENLCTYIRRWEFSRHAPPSDTGSTTARRSASPPKSSAPHQYRRQNPNPPSRRTISR